MMVVSPGVTIREAIVLTSQLSLARSDDTHSSGRYISVVLIPGAVPFIRFLRNAAFQQDKTQLP